MTFYELLKSKALPVESAQDTGEIHWLPDVELTPAITAAYTDAVLEYFNPTEWQAVLTYRTLIQQIKDEYINMIGRLDQIQAASSPTNAQVIQAVKDEALYIQRILKFLRRTMA